MTKKAAYVAIGTDLEWRKDMLGIWLVASESAKYCLNVPTRLQNRGVQDILIVSVDGLQGCVDPASPKADVQRCISHQIRASIRYVSYKDLKKFTADLKPIYKAPTEELALAALDELEQHWGKQYSLGVKSWWANWTKLTAMFKIRSRFVT